MSGWNDASLSGAAHLTSFKGTDCVSAIDLLNHHYDASATASIVGTSVPATEHSVMGANILLIEKQLQETGEWNAVTLQEV